VTTPPTTARRSWRLVLGVLAFVVLAPVNLVALPLAALLLATHPGTGREWLALAVTGGIAAALLLTPESGLLDALTRAWIVLVSAAFAVSARLRPAAFWPLALRACLYGAAGVALLGAAVVGPPFWSEVQWEATRGASGAMRQLVAFVPPLYPAFEPAVRVVGRGWPAWLVLETLVGLALARQLHGRVARRPLAARRAEREPLVLNARSGRPADAAWNP
jgi:hypothetical protein